jgi:general stress protein 26
VCDSPPRHKMQELIFQAKQILEKIQFMHLATISDKGRPWNSPVWFACDKNFTFFWNSSKEAQHSKNIRNNNNIFVVVSDYDIKRAVYMEGKAYELDDEAEIKEILEVFYKRKGKTARPVIDIINESPRRMYKFIPEKFYINTYEKVNELPNDQRVEIKIKNNFLN